MFFKIMNHNTKKFKKTLIPFPLFDIYKIEWMKGIKSSIHDHSKHGCFMLLYKGILKENIYQRNIHSKKLEIIKTNIHNAPKITYINDKIGFHDVKSLKNSSSIHFYFPKGHKTKYYS